MSDPVPSGNPLRRRSIGGLPTLLAVALAAPVAAATIPVDTLADAVAEDGVCALREAIVAANLDQAGFDCPAGAGDDRIEFTVAGTIDLASDLPTVTGTLEIDGASAVAVRGNQHRMLALDGDPDGRTLTVAGLLLREGANTVPGGCLTVGSGDRLVVLDSRVQQCRAEAGGAIGGVGAALVHVARSRISGNAALEIGGGVAVFGLLARPPAGGSPPVELVLEDSTVSDNETLAGDAPGGGVSVVAARLRIRRSTLSGNLATSAGGGIYAFLSEVELRSATLVGNEALGGPRRELGPVVFGGALYVAGNKLQAAAASFRNSVLAGNLSAGEPNEIARGINATVESLGFNLVGVNLGVEDWFPQGLPNADDDWVGTIDEPLASGLGSLAENGGPTPTRLPLAGSVAIDHGDCPGAPRDQRGFGDLGTGLRPVDDPTVPDASDGCDIGSTEAGGVQLPILLFADGFESGDAGAWSSVVP